MHRPGFRGVVVEYPEGTALTPAVRRLMDDSERQAGDILRRRPMERHGYWVLTKTDTRRPWYTGANLDTVYIYSNEDQFLSRRLLIRLPMKLYRIQHIAETTEPLTWDEDETLEMDRWTYNTFVDRTEPNDQKRPAVPARAHGARKFLFFDTLERAQERLFAMRRDPPPELRSTFGPYLEPYAICEVDRNELLGYFYYDAGSNVDRAPPEFLREAVGQVHPTLLELIHDAVRFLPDFQMRAYGEVILTMYGGVPLNNLTDHLRPLTLG